VLGSPAGADADERLRELRGSRASASDAGGAAAAHDDDERGPQQNAEPGSAGRGMPRRKQETLAIDA